jgi:SagB-type dehydrogenase family enzyme
VFDATDSRSLALLYHLNSEPWLTSEAYQEEGHEIEFKEMGAIGESIALPPASTNGAVGELIRRRGSCRQYARRPLALADLSEILAGSYGLTRVATLQNGIETCLRAVPSAGALYPLELYLLLERVETLDDGLYHYNILDHALEPLRLGVSRIDLADCLLAAPLVEDANALVLISAVFDRTLHKYGSRGYRYILIEAGHVAQNLSLLAAERDLATLCVGGFMDAAMNRFLGLEARTEAVVYCVGIGHPG